VPHGRDVPVRADDTFIVSYPKSGNTWIRFLLSGILAPDEPTSYRTIDRVVPSIHTSKERILRNMDDPRVLKSHEFYDPRYPRVVYIARDPHDIVVSYYYSDIKRGRISEEEPINKYVDRFLRGELDAYGPWAEHVGSWLGAREKDHNFLFLRYEDVLRDTQTELHKIAQFMRIPVEDETVARAIKFSSPEYMRVRERMDGDDTELLRGTRQDIPFIRAAKSGGWGKELSLEAGQRIKDKFGWMMKKIGYLA